MESGVAGLFYHLGKKFGPKVRHGLWVWKGLFGSEEELIAAENVAGADIAEEVRNQTPLDDDPKARQFVDSIGSTLAGYVANPLRRFAFAILSNGQPNAFALPGGFVFVTRAILELCLWNRDEIAFILAHEMAHVIRKHPMQRLMESSAMSAATRVLPVRGAMGSWIRKTGLSIVEKAYSQDRELDADQLGIELALAAGFDGRAAERLLFRLAAIQQEHNLPLGEYFSTHPPFETRIVELRHIIRKKT